MQFPLSANYPPPGQQPPVLSTAMALTGAGGCDAPLGSVTFDATRPSVTMTKVSERFGSPGDAPASRRSLLANETTLFVLMLFNFSKPGGVPTYLLSFSGLQTAHSSAPFQ